MPIAREPVKNGIRNRRSIARVARRRAIERQRTEDAQVEHNESLTRNRVHHMAATRRRAWGKYDSMNEDGPNGSPYETLAKHNVTSRQGRSPDLGYVDFRMTKH
jgi:hypothetical protein